MTEAHTTTIIALLAVTIVLLLWIIISLGRITNALLRKTPAKTIASPPKSPTAPDPTPANPNTDFEHFLAEDPQRQFLVKKEQAAAYREWRKKRGLTWQSHGNQPT